MSASHDSCHDACTPRAAALFSCQSIIPLHKPRAPNGAARFEELVKGGFFTDIKFFRVVSGFMAQFGIAGDPAVAAQWRTKCAMKPELAHHHSPTA